MSTIACDGKSVAGDGQSMTRNGMIQDVGKEKVRQLSGGRLLGHIGTAYDTDVLVEWIEAGADVATVPKFVEDQFAAFILNKDGTLTSVNWNGRLCPSDLPAALGSGEEIAMGALAHGATAEEAVEIAARLDIRTGGKITVLHLEERS